MVVVMVVAAPLSSPSLAFTAWGTAPAAKRTRFLEVDASVSVEGPSSRPCFFPAADGIVLEKGGLGGTMVDIICGRVLEPTPRIDRGSWRLLVEYKGAGWKLWWVRGVD